MEQKQKKDIGTALWIIIIVVVHKLISNLIMTLPEERFEELKDKLLTAFIEEKDDMITLVTIIDLYCEEVNAKGSLEQKVDFLKFLLGLLQQNKDVVYEIGWDLPKILINFIHWANRSAGSLEVSKQLLCATMKCFNEVALFGNAKECFFAGCELMKSIKINDESLIRLILEEETLAAESEGEDENESESEEGNHGDADDDEKKKKEKKKSTKDSNLSEESDLSRDMEAGVQYYGRQPQELIAELRFHAIIELIGSTLKRVVTLYPSKFLSEAVSSLVLFISHNNSEMDDALFALRRIYSFIRGYIPPSPPSNANEEVSEEDSKTIKDAEEVLQRKLICNLLTISAAQLLKEKTLNANVRYHNSIHPGSEMEVISDYSNMILDMVFRYYQLAISFDIDVAKEFQRLCIDESKRIYRSLPKNEDIKSEEELKEITNLSYQLAYTYEIEKVANVKEILLHPAGICMLYTLSGENNLPEPDIKLSVEDAIYLYLRFCTPPMLSSIFENKALQDAARMWVLYALTNSSVTESMESLKNIPSYLVSLFLQVELFRASHQISDTVRKLEFSVITRVLCLMPEDFAFNFIKDTLLSCPYEQAKCCVLAILKDMMIRGKRIQSENKADDIVNDMEKLRIQDKPPLPARPYILINEDRIATLHSIAILSINDCVISPESSKLRTLLTYLNFFITFQKKWDQDLLKEICDKVNEQILTQEKSSDEIKTQYPLIEHAVESISAKF